MIKISDVAEFKRLIHGLSTDIVDAHVHYRLHNALLEAAKRYPLVMQQSNTFWSMTLKAHLSTSIAALTKAYDQDDRALHLCSWLATIKDNINYFEVENFKARLAGNPFVDSLALDSRMPDLAQLELDMYASSDREPLVRTLLLHRNNSIAHRNGKVTARAINLGETHPLRSEDFETLLARSLEILNRYSSLFEASLYSVSVIGANDYEFIFSCIDKAVAASYEVEDAQVAAIYAVSTNVPPTE